MVAPPPPISASIPRAAFWWQTTPNYRCHSSSLPGLTSEKRKHSSTVFGQWQGVERGLLLLGCINLHDELSRGVRMCEHCSHGEAFLQLSEGGVSFGGPGERGRSGGELGERGGHSAVVPDKGAIEVGEPEELSKLFKRDHISPILASLHSL